MFRLPFALVALILLPGCELLTGLLNGGSGMLETRTSSVQSQDGIATIDVDVSGESAFQLTATSGQLLAVEAVNAPDGSQPLYWDDWSGVNSLTSAVWLEGKDTVLNWPVRQADGNLSDGTWTVDVAVVDDQGYYTDDQVDVVLKLKDDSDLSTGTVNARIVYADGLKQDSVVTAGVQDAVTRWAEIWAPYGINLETSYEDSSFSTDQPFPGEGSEQAEVSSGANGSEITVLITETIDGSTDYYGIAGGIPGTLDYTDHALVIVSWLTNAGGDGEFSDDDIRLFGETLAHEVGHYMGLFHPVETTFDYWDALDDTDDCGGQSACESALGDNLMFPYPVCDWTSCTPQDQLTSQQAGVNQRYTGTL
ncbi:MAG: hypothetical protein GXP62_17875 [Oligoflexia bacterium]|nr:hypothetical protein [Oligoflexia bacterium]